MITKDRLIKLYNQVLDMYPGHKVIWNKREVLYMIQKLIEECDE